MIWTIIANFSAFVTLISFILYIIGRIWTINISKNIILETFKFEKIKDDTTIEYINLAGKYGRVFSISSPEGIKEIKVFKINLNQETFTAEGNISFSKEKIIKNLKNINPNKKIYIRGQFNDLCSNVYLEIERMDYIKTSFIVADNGKNDEFEKLNYNYTIPIKSWIYYLCK